MHACFKAAPVKARPLSGIGVLSVRSNGETLKIYREPGVGRLAELPPAKLPGIMPQLAAADGTVCVVVLSQRPDWLRIILNDGEDGGWVARRRGMSFHPWEEFLHGRSFSLSAGLRQEQYQLRSEPLPEAEIVAPVERGERLQGGAVAGNWIQVRTGTGQEGWLRWRDDNGRLMIGIPAPD